MMLNVLFFQNFLLPLVYDDIQRPSVRTQYNSTVIRLEINKIKLKILNQAKMNEMRETIDWYSEAMAVIKDVTPHVTSIAISEKLITGESDFLSNLFIV